MTDFSHLEVGYDIPARPGMDIGDVQTPCLVLDLDALERNVKKMGDLARTMGVQLRAHGKMHKSVDVAKLQLEMGGSTGICCQKLSEAETFVRGGILDVLISNQIRDLAKIDRLAQLPNLGARVKVCIDDPENVADLSDAAQKHATTLECLVEIDCGARRCGVTDPADVVDIATQIDSAIGLKFAGVQAYQGNAQHLTKFNDRQGKIDIAIAMVKDSVAALRLVGLDCETITGGGTGSFWFEGSSGIYTEIQCGSYAFMDADYGRVLDKNAARLDQDEWENALFILTSVMSKTKNDQAVVDAGLKVMSLDSGLPMVFGRKDRVEYVTCSDEHGVVSDPDSVLRVNDKLRLVPGHCDPTCNLHDWYVGLRNNKVETLWPVSARGKAF